jgi:hypothetical protein
VSANTRRPRLRFDRNDPRFLRVQELFEQQRPEEGRALLREMLREWLARHSPKDVGSAA